MTDFAPTSANAALSKDTSSATVHRIGPSSPALFANTANLALNLSPSAGTSASAGVALPVTSPTPTDVGAAKHARLATGSQVATRRARAGRRVVRTSAPTAHC